MSKSEDYKKGSNPDGSTSAADVAEIVARARRNAAKGRWTKNEAKGRHSKKRGK